MEALYRRTGGEQWRDRTGWLTDADPCTWAGITCESGRLTRIELPGNGLVGSLPSELGLAAYLVHLDLSANQLEGRLPAELGNLRALTVLDLSGNRLSGALPARVRLLRKLRVLDLQGNALSGPIPALVGELTALEYLNLADNRLTGEVPPELGRLVRLVTLRLDGNDLQGPLPETLTALDTLSTFAFDRTGLLERPEPEVQRWLEAIGDLKRTGVLYAEPVAPDRMGLAALAGLGTLGAALAAAWWVLLPLLGPIAGGLFALTGVAGAGLIGRKVYKLTRHQGSRALPPALAPDRISTREALREKLRTLVRSVRGELDGEVFERLQAVESLLLDVLDRMENVEGANRDAFILRQTIREYLPEALAPYRALSEGYAVDVPIEGERTARDHLMHQLALLEGALREIAERQDEDNARRLLINSRFLEGKFDDRE